MSKVFLILLILVTLSLFIGLCINYPQIFADLIGIALLVVVVRALWLIGEE